MAQTAGTFAMTAHRAHIARILALATLLLLASSVSASGEGTPEPSLVPEEFSVTAEAVSETVVTSESAAEIVVTAEPEETAQASDAAVDADCTPLSGIDDGSPGALNSADIVGKLPIGGVFGSMVDIAAPVYATYESPIALRQTHLLISGVYSAAAAFHPTALDRFARIAESAARRRCAPTNPEEEEFFELHRAISLAFAFSSLIQLTTPPTIKEDIRNLMSSWGLQEDICPGSPGCDTADTPWGLAQAISEDVMLFAKLDGWNADGSLSRSFNKIPFEDYRRRPYVPVNTPWRLSNSERWQPLLENDGLGFLFNQEHVVPHIGDTARSMFLDDGTICAMRAPNPEYNYFSEIEQLLERNRNLDDVKKAEIEKFDNKLNSLVPLQLQYFARQGISLDSFEQILTDASVISASVEAVAIVWKEKVRYDLVRPPSIMRRLLGRTPVNAYAGPNQGIQDLPAEEWEPYIRTMPHSEYPSGSSCLCQAFEDVMMAVTGEDDVTGTLGGPLNLEVAAGESTTEENTPANNITLSYGSWSEIRAACGVSRLNGGMHFTASVPEGERLCSGIGTTVAESFKKLAAGEVPDYIAQFDAPVSRGGRCSR